MGEHVGEEKQVAISMCSTSSGRNVVAVAKQVPPQLLPNGTHTEHKQDHGPRLEAPPLLKKAMAEFIGTFILVFTVLSTAILNDKHPGVESLLGMATSAGLAVVVVVLSTIHISGSHLNPAVSLAMAVFGHLPWLHVAPYAAAQTLASVCASFLAKGLHRPADPAVMATVPAAGVGRVEAFFLEFVVTFVLLFVITAVVTDPHAVKELIAVAIGATIMMNALIAGPATGPSMNPARTLGAAIVTGKYTHILIYFLATPLGAIAGMGTYKLIKL